MTLVEFSFVPSGNGGRAQAHVERVMRMIERSGLRHTKGPKGASLEGEWEEISRLLGRALEELSRDCGRIGLVVNVDYRGGTVHPEKSESVSAAESPGRILGRMPALVP